MFKEFFKRRKYRAIAFAELPIKWTDGTTTVFSIVFFENDNDERRWTISGNENERRGFSPSGQHASCETWRHTGLLTEWAKDPLAEKLCR